MDIDLIRTRERERLSGLHYDSPEPLPLVSNDPTEIEHATAVAEHGTATVQLYEDAPHAAMLYAGARSLEAVADEMEAKLLDGHEVTAEECIGFMRQVAGKLRHGS